MSDALPLPPAPNLEQYKKLARELQGACLTGDPQAIADWATAWVETLQRLQDPARGSGTEKDVTGQARQLQQRWTKLRAAEGCQLSKAQYFLARQHGFASWPRFARHVRALMLAGSSVSNFEEAVDAIVSGDEPGVRRLLQEHPELVRERSTREHRSTLLHYVSANGVEDFRQKTPRNIVDIARLLLDAGADVHAESDAYGGGCTVLGLVATSVHPERAGVQILLLQLLLERGARYDRPNAGNGHSMVQACLANGQPGAAAFFASLGAPLDLKSAAALGRLPVVERWLPKRFDERGMVIAPDESSELRSAFLYACGYGSLEVVRYLLDVGADPSLGNMEGQTGLHWAAYGTHPDVVSLLLERGAAIDSKDKLYGGTPLDTALWVWSHASGEDRDDRQKRDACYRIVALLSRAGARLEKQHWLHPGASTSEILQKIDSDVQMLAALRGKYAGGGGSANG